MEKKHDQEALQAHFNETVDKFEKYWNDPDRFSNIFTEQGFSYVDDGCDGFCPECEKMMKCEVYKDLKPEWDKF